MLFHDLLEVVGSALKDSIYTYGSYEAMWLRRMFKEAGQQEVGQTILARVVNILSIIHAHIYVPTYSNGLKDIGRYLGCSWTDPDASGLQSIVWRKRWEETGATDFKDTLTTYNMEDCTALRTVTAFLQSICQEPPRLSSPTPPPSQSKGWCGSRKAALQDHIRS